MRCKKKIEEKNRTLHSAQAHNKMRKKKLWKGMVVYSVVHKVRHKYVFTFHTPYSITYLLYEEEQKEKRKKN